jgi:DNA-binding CsgD family transcriptional regulator
MNLTAELTLREWEVIGCMANGYAAKEIAEELKIKPKTAENHLQHAKVKINCQKNTELSLFWFCRQFDIPIEEVNSKMRKIATLLLLIVTLQIGIENNFNARPIRVRIASRIELFSRKNEII